VGFVCGAAVDSSQVALVEGRAIAKVIMKFNEAEIIKLSLQTLKYPRAKLPCQKHRVRQPRLESGAGCAPATDHTAESPPGPGSV
jgi:hypothetical protein